MSDDQSLQSASASEELDSRAASCSEDGIEPLKSRSASVDSDDMGMMMGDPVTKDLTSSSTCQEKLPTVLESKEEKSSPKNLQLLTPPESANMHKVSSATSIKLMGVPVKDNDPLGTFLFPILCI